MRIDTEFNIGDIVWRGTAKVERPDSTSPMRVVPQVESFEIGFITVIVEKSICDGEPSNTTWEESYSPVNRYDVAYQILFRTEEEARAHAAKCVQSHPANKPPK